MKKPTAARKQRRKLTAEFKAKAALAALREDKAMAELYGVDLFSASKVPVWIRALA